ncbi:MAG TPA: elongation factor G, partial [Bacilli bacterium]|nr:elongation factor G [Bacilli bacterium]
IVFGSAVKNVCVHELLNMMSTLLPSPLDAKPKTGVNPKTGDKITRLPDENLPFSGYVFKTIIDPFLGTMNLFYVASGNTKGLADPYLANKDQTIKVGQFVTLMGKTQIPVDVLHAGDIGVALKMDLETGATFCDRRDPVLYDAVEIPTPIIYVAIVAKTKQDEDKISSALQRLNIEDPSFEIKRNPETSQLLIGGQGMTHIGYILDKMKNMYKVDVDITEP